MPPCPDRPLALSMGEPAGIGGEVALKAWLAREAEAVPPFVLIDDPDRLVRLAAALGWTVPIAPVADAGAALACFGRALPVLAQPLDRPATPGRPDVANAPAVLAALERGIALARQGAVAGLVTNPIHKRTLYEAGFRHPGHTEFLAERCGGGAVPVMMLACPGLRVVPVTVHLALSEVAGSLSRAAIVAAGRILGRALRDDFGIAAPRLAVAALNPHAGEGGSLGDEEARIIAPAADDLRAEGFAVAGPAPADTLFHAEARAGYDAALCMYHDQALLPLKTIDFWRGVNVTLGLPIVRTSPDHGTAFDLAGTGRADARSLIAALRMAAEIGARRARRP